MIGTLALRAARRIAHRRRGRADQYFPWPAPRRDPRYAPTPTTDQLATQIEAITANLPALTDRVRTLFDIADHVPAVNEDQALSLTNTLAKARDLLRSSEEPLRRATWHASCLDVPPLATTPVN